MTKKYTREELFAMDPQELRRIQVQELVNKGVPIARASLVNDLAHKAVDDAIEALQRVARLALSELDQATVQALALNMIGAFMTDAEKALMSCVLCYTLEQGKSVEEFLGVLGLDPSEHPEIKEAMEAAFNTEH